MNDNSTIDRKFFRQLYALLLLIFFFKLGGFFTWSENVGVTRVLKVFMRVGMTVAIWYVYRRIARKGAVASFTWTNEYSVLLYIGYLLLGLVSFLWSTNIGYSALQWFMDVESLMFAYYFMASFVMLDTYFPQSGIRFSNIIGNGVMMMMCIFIVGMFVTPDKFYRLTHGGEEARLGGLFMNPNELGMLGGVGISCFIFDLYERRRRFWVVMKILALLYVVLLTGSRSSTVGCLIVAFFHIRQGNNVRLRSMMYALAILAVPLAVTKIMIKEGGMEEVLSMTGRLPFWKALITEGLPREIMLGFGFMRIDYTETFVSVHTYAGHMTHNTFIQVLMNLGFVGFTLVLLQVVFTFYAFFSTREKQKRLMLLGIIIPVLINSFTEFGIFGETNYGILFYQLLMFYVCISNNTLLTPAEKRHLRHTSAKETKLAI